MSDYRRARVPGACYFFTVTLLDRRSDLLRREVALLRDCVRATRERYPFHIDAWVVLPEHMHCLWTLPADDRDFGERWRIIKASFSRRVPASEGDPTRARMGGRGIWQPRYWEHLIRDEADYCRHFDYIHINPLKHGHVSRVIDWPYSSFHRAVRQGIYPADWGGEVKIEDGRFGER